MGRDICMTRDVTMDTFEHTVDTNDIVVLDFWAEWCKPCKIFAPIFEDLALKNSDVFFGKVNTEVATDLSQAFHVRSIPTLMVFMKGDLVFEQSGIVSPMVIHELLERLRSSSDQA
jgi:thioredoxin